MNHMRFSLSLSPPGKVFILWILSIGEISVVDECYCSAAFSFIIVALGTSPPLSPCPSRACALTVMIVRFGRDAGVWCVPSLYFSPVSFMVVSFFSFFLYLYFPFLVSKSAWRGF